MADLIEQKGIKGVLDFLDPTRMRKKVIRPMINKTARLLKKDAENKISGMKGQKGIFNIIKKRVKAQTSLKLMKQHSLKEEATVTFHGKRPGLQHFGPNKKLINKKKSPKFRIKKGKPLETLERSFFLKDVGIGGKGEGVFQREGKDSYPIHRRTGPSAKQMYEDPEVRIPVEAQKDVNQEKFFKEHFDKEYGGKR